MVDHPRIFKAADFTGILSVFEKYLNESNEIRDDFTLAEFSLPTALKIAQKTKSDVRKWHNEIGFAYFRLAEMETDEERNWLKIDNYVDALEAFKLGGNTEMVNRVEQLYAELKPKVKLNDVQIMFDGEMVSAHKKFMEENKKAVDDLLKWSPEEIYAYLAAGNFFPRSIDVKNNSKPKDFFSSDFCNVIFFDKNKNITRGSDETFQESVFQTYSFHISYMTLPVIERIFVEGIRIGHLTSVNFLRFLKQKSWMGRPSRQVDLGGNQQEFDLLRLVAPAIYEYFNHIQAWTISKSYMPNFVLCIDSLALKIEVIMRNFCERINVPTSTNKKKGMQEVLLHDIFNNDIVKKYYNENDRMLFDFLFSSHSYNLRNNVAHGYYLAEEYTHQKMLLLLSALLRIAKLNYKTES